MANTLRTKNSGTTAVCSTAEAISIVSPATVPFLSLHNGLVMAFLPITWSQPLREPDSPPTSLKPTLISDTRASNSSLLSAVLPLSTDWVVAP